MVENQVWRLYQIFFFSALEMKAHPIADALRERTRHTHPRVSIGRHFARVKIIFPGVESKWGNAPERRLPRIRVAGIEPALHAWEARVLPLNDTRSKKLCP